MLVALLLAAADQRQGRPPPARRGRPTGPMRSLGPGRSWRMATPRPARSAAARTRSRSRPSARMCRGRNSGGPRPGPPRPAGPASRGCPRRGRSWRRSSCGACLARLPGARPEVSGPAPAGATGPATGRRSRTARRPPPASRRHRSGGHAAQHPVARARQRVAHVHGQVQRRDRHGLRHDGEDGREPRVAQGHHQRGIERLVSRRRSQPPVTASPATGGSAAGR